MRPLWVVAACVLAPQLAHAAVQCKVVDYQVPQPWTQDQKNTLPTLAARLVDAASGNTALHISDNVATGTVCFDTTVDVASLLTEPALLADYALFQQALQAAALAEQTRQDALLTEQQTNDLCTAELSEITTRIDTTVSTLQSQLAAAPNNLAGVKTHLSTQLYPTLGAAFKKVAKCLKARTDQGVGQ